MQRDLSVTIGVIGFILVVGILIISTSQNKSLRLSDSNEIPTSNLVLGENNVTQQPTMTPTVTTTPPLIKSPTVTVTPTITTTPIATQTPTATTSSTPRFTCTTNSVVQKVKVLANQFMNTHKAKDLQVLNLITAPESDQDKGSLAFWLGEDVGNAPRLYETTTTTYTTVEFNLEGSLTDRGNDPDIRGTKKCQQAVRETRRIETPFSEDKFTRYLNFSLSEDGQVVLTGFAEGIQGQKYTGFN